MFQQLGFYIDYIMNFPIKWKAFVKQIELLKKLAIKDTIKMILRVYNMSL